jgi:hypothetical protein
MVLFAPMLIMGAFLTLIEAWIGSDPAHVTAAGYDFLFGSWLLGLALLITALVLGRRASDAWIGKLSLTLSATALICVAALVAWTAWTQRGRSPWG